MLLERVKARLVDKELELAKFEESLEMQQKRVEKKEVEIDVKEEIIEEKAEKLLEEGSNLRFFSVFLNFTFFLEEKLEDERIELTSEKIELEEKIREVFSLKTFIFLR